MVRRKNPSGSVVVYTQSERLKLRWSWCDKRYYLSVGLPDPLISRLFAERKAKDIELDILSGHFDESLKKYKGPSAQHEEKRQSHE